MIWLDPLLNVTPLQAVACVLLALAFVVFVMGAWRL